MIKKAIAVVQGFTNLALDREITEESARIKKCRACPSFNKKQPIYWCNECTCHMKAKVKAPIARCPIGRWKNLKFDIENE